MATFLLLKHMLPVNELSKRHVINRVGSLFLYAFIYMSGLHPENGSRVGTHQLFKIWGGGGSYVTMLFTIQF